MSKEEIVRGCNPAGMMECWNIGKMGLQIQKYWRLDLKRWKITKFRSQVSLLNPIFHHSAIPLFQGRDKNH
jgi:hypothetical protein